MSSLKQKYSTFKKQLKMGKVISSDPYFNQTKDASHRESQKDPSRSTIINTLLQHTAGLNYLEIGVRNPEHNFNKIKCKNKYSVDPGYEFKSNPATYKMTSDAFFKKLKNNDLDISPELKFDVIFIDGLHTAEQVDKDITNSLKFLRKIGCVVLHDCNPPTEFHQRECFDFKNSPARQFWNGTTWKAYYKYRHNQNLFSGCFDTDWGVAVLSQKPYPMFNNLNTIENSYFEYSLLHANRKRYLNLIDFSKWKELLYL